MIKNEVELFYYLKKYFFKNLTMSSDQFDIHDCHTQTHYIELKCRRVHYDELILEKKKYDNLIKNSLDINLNPLYISSTPKGIYAFYLDDIKFKWYKKMLPITTDFDNNQKIEKIICTLHIKDAVELIVKNDI
jgi:hypothetical protein